MNNPSEEFQFDEFVDQHEWVVVRARTNKRDSLLKDGFPILLDKNTRLICEPVLLFIYQTYLEECAKEFVLNTCLAYTFDCKDWMQFLESFSLSWLDARYDDLVKYVRIMDSTYSPETGQRYSTRTINRRSMCVLLFYFWASKFFKSNDGKEDSLLQVDTSLRKTQKRYKKLKLPRKEEEDVAVRVLTKSQARSLLESLGPTPSEWNIRFGQEMPKNQKGGFNISGRDRLCAETALKTGLRISGICSLKLSHFSQFRSIKLSPLDLYIVKVSEKGKVRAVKFPGELISQIIFYIENERAYIVRCCGGVGGEALFLNGLSAGRHSGRKVTARTLERAISVACFECGLTEVQSRRYFVENTHGELEEIKENRTVASYVFHQLRHTFAVWLYYCLQRAGIKEPWLIIQARLGHSSDEVTRDVYLAAVGEFEAEVSDRYMESFYVAG